jgi:hypothetical protein
MKQYFRRDPSARLVAVQLSESEIQALLELLGTSLQPNGNQGAGVSPRTRAIVKILSAFVSPPGQCMVCGCTDEAPGGHGCKWVTPEHTLCTNCVERG